jgi:hypothetical protein
MKRLNIILVFFFTAVSSLSAQDFAEISVGNSYANQAYYSLETDEVVNLENESWDLAFTLSEGTAGVLYNESATLSFTGDAPIVRVYLAPTNNFEDVFDPAVLVDSLYNGEASWEDGAFNSVKEEDDPLDYGWGLYNETTDVIEGNRVFAFKLRNDEWLKVQIISLENGVYTMKYASLDGTNEQTVTIDKADFGDSPLALFSFASDEAVASPANWDLFFGRYLSGLDNGSGEIQQYRVTGLLSGPGVEIAEARNIDPETVDYKPYLDSLETRLDVIGHDWKFFDLGNFEWVLDEERAYFIKLPNDQLWKVIFLTFEGSSTGTTVIEKELIGELTSATAPISNIEKVGLFPNPVQDQLTLSVSLLAANPNLSLTLFNGAGQIVWRNEVNAQAGLNVWRFEVPEVPAGVYRLVLGEGNDVAVKTLVKQ